MELIGEPPRDGACRWKALKGRCDEHPSLETPLPPRPGTVAEAAGPLRPLHQPIRVADDEVVDPPSSASVPVEALHS